MKLDRLHHECIQAQASIRAAFQDARIGVARWTPRPCPPDWGR